MSGFEVVPFTPDHIEAMRVQDAQKLPSREQREAMAAPFGRAWTALVDGHPVACAGMVELWEGRAYAWGLIGEDAGPWMRRITRAIRSALGSAGYRRVEIAVDAQFGAGCRWAHLLGFELEALAKAYMPNGRDAFIYSRVK
jgi:hypothetical protein